MSKENEYNFVELCEKNYARILKYCYLKMGDQEYARDLVQDVFVIAWNKRAMLAQHENPLGFLYKTASNLCYERIRQRKKEIPCDMAEHDIYSEDSDLLATVVKNKDQMIDVGGYRNEVLSILSEENLGLYEEYYVMQIPMKDIARQHGMSQTSLRMRYVRIRRQIKEQIGKIELSESDDVTYYLGRHI